MALASACGSSMPPEPIPAEPIRGGGGGAPIRPLDSYRELGFLTGPPTFPAVAVHATLAGAADSTLLLLGLSLPAAALRFQRDEGGFAAEYVVAIRLARDGVVEQMIDRREVVRVRSFEETARSDEAVIFQTAVQLEPGRYVLTLRARDGLSARGMDAVDTVDVPAYGAGARRLAAPLIAHEAAGRPGRGAEPDVVLNPRHTLPYGEPPAHAYVEVYGGAGPAGRARSADGADGAEGADRTHGGSGDRAGGARLVLEDEGGAEIWARRLELEGDAELAWAVVVLPTATLPLGRFRLALERGGERAGPVPLVVAVSDHWIVANFEEVLEFLRYIASAEELQALRSAGPPERRERWESFWAGRDPVPASPDNEFRDIFLDRVRVATEQFGEPGRSGWRTDRGEVYIVLGPPSGVDERQSREAGGTAGSRAQEWTYDDAATGRVRLVFVDRSGLGRWQLTAASRSAFDAAARRLRPHRP